MEAKNESACVSRFWHTLNIRRWSKLTQSPPLRRTSIPGCSFAPWDPQSLKKKILWVDRDVFCLPCTIVTRVCPLKLFVLIWEFVILLTKLAPGMPTGSLYRAGLSGCTEQWPLTVALLDLKTGCIALFVCSLRKLLLCVDAKWLRLRCKMFRCNLCIESAVGPHRPAYAT